ncbi:hypothetical protein HOD29_04455 [archaeon]|nr:hypothetical protein [archaeon]
MGNLEKILGNVGKGFVTGLVKPLDPVGTAFSGGDKYNTGVGYSDKKRALKTIHNHAYQAVYNKPEEKLSFGKDYVPRIGGKVLGAGAGVAGLFGLYVVGGPLAALAIPVVTGIYSGINSIGKYVQDIFSKKGEKIGDTYEKASFKDGFNFGWEKSSHLYMNGIYDLEGEFSGRGFANSRLETSIKKVADKPRRNFTSLLGNLVGNIVGVTASVLTLGILPLYKSIRDTTKIIEGSRA